MNVPKGNGEQNLLLNSSKVHAVVNNIDDNFCNFKCQMLNCPCSEEGSFVRKGLFFLKNI